MDNVWRAVDTPFLLPANWEPRLKTGRCSHCNGPALRGKRRWWHRDKDCWTGGKGPGHTRPTAVFIPDKEIP